MSATIHQKNTVKILRMLYPLWVLFGIFGIIYVPSALLDFSDPIKTVENLREHSLLFRLGIIGRLLSQFLFILIPFFLYKLFKDLDKSTSLLMLILAIVSTPMAMGYEVLNLYALSALDTPEHLMVSLDLYYQGMDIAMIFWGLWLFPLGKLVYTSGLFPKFIGVILYLAGVGYLLDSCIGILFPDVTLFNSVLEILTIGEVVFIIWIVFLGVRKKTNTETAT